VSVFVVMFVSFFLFVCVAVQNISQSYKRSIGIAVRIILISVISADIRISCGCRKIFQDITRLA